MNIISIAEIEFSKFSLTDDVGKVFYWNGRIFRAIAEHAVAATKELFSCGLIEELNNKHLIPYTIQSELCFEGLGFVLEHESVPYQTYPFEWSFEMLRSAGLLVLELTKIASAYGYMLKDCHPYNILFMGCKPIYVDIGSLFKTKNPGSEFPSVEFMTQYIAPLTIWSDGNEYLARQSLSFIASRGLSVDSFQNYKRAIFKHSRNSNKNLLRKLERFTQRIINAICKYSQSPSLLDSLLVFASGFFVVSKLSVLEKKISKFKIYYHNTEWSSYHDEYTIGDGVTSTPRFDKLIEIIDALDVKSVVDLASNQGAFSIMLADRTKVKRIVCIDREVSAIDKLYLRLVNLSSRRNTKIIQPVLCDIINNPAIITQPPVANRLKADLVVALAITHHLLLGQHMGIDDILRRISDFTDRYAIVEFMPLGLWNGKNAPTLPTHYNLEWFLSEFSKLFVVLKIIYLEPNRIAVVGEIKSVNF